MARSVVITGCGSVSGYGFGVDALWEGLVEGRSSLGPIRSFDASGFRSRLAAEAIGFSAKDHVPKTYRKAVKVMARDIELAVGAAKEAIERAGVVTRECAQEGQALTYPGGRTGCHIGAGYIAPDTEELARAYATSVDEAGAFSFKLWGEQGMNNLTPLWLLKYLPNMLACHVTILHGSEGPSNTITCCESSGLLSIGESMRVIERGNADICFSGGAECKVSLMGLIRMDLGGRLAPTGESEDGAAFVLPYDPDAKGTLLGEGGAILMMEAGEAARSRGAGVLAEVAGFGAAQSSPFYDDGFDDEGYELSLRAALEDAGIGPDDIDAIVPLGCGVPALDSAEAGAMERVFAGRCAEIPLVTICPMVGNCMAGAGALQACVGVRCLVEQRLPARIHRGRPRAGLLAGASSSREAALRHVLVCTGALGGQNAAIVLRRADGS